MSLKAWLSNVSPDKETSILVAAFIGVFALGLVVAVGPVRKEFDEVDAAIAGSEKTVARNFRLLKPASVDTVQSEYRRHGEYLARKGSTEESNAAMLAEIERIAGECKIVMARTTPRKPVVDRDSEEYAVELEIESDMEQAIRFLHSLETSSQVLRVDNVTLDSKGAREPGVLKGSLLVSRVVTL